jgi:hypothetical protein
VTLKKLDHAFKKDNSVFGPFPAIPASQSAQSFTIGKLDRVLNPMKGKVTRPPVAMAPVRHPASKTFVTAPPLINPMKKGRIHGIVRAVTLPTGRPKRVPRVAAVHQFSDEIS